MSPINYVISYMTAGEVARINHMTNKLCAKLYDCRRDGRNKLCDNHVTGGEMARINYGRPESYQILRAWEYANQSREFQFLYVSNLRNC